MASAFFSIVAPPLAPLPALAPLLSLAPGRLGRGRGEPQSDGENSTEDNRCETGMVFVRG